MFGRKKQTRRSTPLSQEEEKRLLGRITEQEEELKVDPVFGSSLQRKKTRNAIKKELKKLSRANLKNMVEGKGLVPVNNKGGNIEIMSDYFNNQPDEWRDWIAEMVTGKNDVSFTDEDEGTYNLSFTDETEEEQKEEKKRGRPRTRTEKQIKEQKEARIEYLKNKEIERKFGKFKPLEGEELKKFRGERDYKKDDRYNDDYDDEDFGDFVGYQDNSDLVDINEDVEVKGREEVKIKDERLTAEAPRFSNNLDEFINSVKEDFSNTDLLNTNQNIPGINEMKARQRQQDKTNEEKYIPVRDNIKNNPLPTFIEQLESKYDNNQPTASEINRLGDITDDRRNPIYNSSMADNSNYEVSRENAFNNILELMEDNGFVDRNYLEDIQDLPLESLNNIYIGMLGREREHKSNVGSEVKINNPNPIAQNISSVVSHNIPEGSVIERLRNLGESSIGQAIGKGGLQGYQRGGIRGAVEGSARAGVAQAIGDNLGGGIIGQIGQRAGQEGISQISDIMSRLMGSDVPQDESEQLVQQINKINEHLERLDEPSKYPEMREIQRITFPDEKINDNRNNVKLVQNAITQFINDKNLYGQSTYEESNDILLDI